MRALLLAKGVGSIAAAQKMRYNSISSIHVYEGEDKLNYVENLVNKTIGGSVIVERFGNIGIKTPSLYIAQALVAVHYAESAGFDAVIAGWTNKHMRHGTYLNLTYLLSSVSSKVLISAPFILTPEAEVERLIENFRGEFLV